MRKCLFVLTVLIGASACARSARSSGSPTGLGSNTSAVARVVCEGYRPRILTPTVSVQPDGVHFVIENATDSTFVFSPAPTNPNETTSIEFASYGDNLVPPGIKSMVWRVPPGLTSVACLPRGGVKPADRIRSRMALFRLVDPERIYIPIPPDVDCQGGASHSYGLTVFLRPGDEPVRVVRQRFVGLRPSDAVHRAGYPSDPDPWVTVARQGRIVALVNIGPAVSSDSSVLSTCRNSGIRPADQPSESPEPAYTRSPIPLEKFPRQSDLVEGGTYWALYLAIAKEGSSELDDSAALAERYGYRPEVRTLGCDEGAAEQYHQAKDLVAVAVYFPHESDAWFVADGIDSPHYGEPIKIVAHCVA